MRKFSLWFECIGILVAFFLGVYVCFGAYVIQTPQPLARSLTEAQLEAVLDKAPTAKSVTLPAHLVAKRKDEVQANLILEQLSAVIQDTRTNIVECAEMSDVEIAILYLKQMQKQANEIENTSTTNTIERIIGAGMREDIQEQGE